MVPRRYGAISFFSSVSLQLKLYFVVVFAFANNSHTLWFSAPISVKSCRSSKAPRTTDQMPISVGNYTIFEQVDLTSDLNAYGARHAIALATDNFGGSPLPITTDAAYWIRITGETGADARDRRLKLLAIDITIDP